MARDGASAERRRVALRVLLARGEGASSSSSPPPRGPEEEAPRGKQQQWLALRLRDLGCASAAASRAHAPVAASASVRPAAEEEGEGEEEDDDEWRASRQQRRRRRRERRGARVAGGGGGGVAAAGDVWCTCTPGIPFAAEASSVDCVVARHHHTAAPGRRGDGERRHRERTAEQRARRVTMREHISTSFMDSPPRFHMPFHDADLPHSGRHRHAHPYDRTDEEVHSNIPSIPSTISFPPPREQPHRQKLTPVRYFHPAFISSLLVVHDRPVLHIPQEPFRLGKSHSIHHRQFQTLSGSMLNLILLY
ncbi:hypothetical protein VPH35_010868 [Triticum aestivum]